MANSAFPLLSLLIVLPPMAGLLLLLSGDARQARAGALLAALLDLALALLVPFDLPETDMGWGEKYAWIETIKVHYMLGVDGISAPFLPLTGLLCACVIAASPTGLPAAYYAWLLWLEGATLGVFCALDLGLFFLFWELTLPPLYFLINLWGSGPQRRLAAARFTVLMLGGSMALLLAFVMLALNNAQEADVAAPTGLSFDYAVLLETPASLATQSAIFLLLLLGFAVRVPLFPFHLWLPALAVEGPAGVATLLMGVQVGLYGIVRFAVPLAPQAAWQWHGLLIGLGALTALYGGLLALKQSSLPRLLAFSSISQAGLALVGVATFTFQGIQGALLQLCNIGILAGGFFLLLSFLRHNVGATDLDALAAAPRHMPLFTSVLLMLVLAGVGLPGSQGFIAWHLLVVGAFKSHVGAGLAVLAVAVLGTAYFFRLFRAACDGPLAPDAAQAIDLKPREVYAASVFVVLALIFGLFPQILLHLTQKPLGNWIARLQSGYVSTLASIAEEPPRRASPAEVGKSVVP